MAGLGYKAKVVKISDPNIKKIVSRLPSSSFLLNRSIAKLSKKNDLKDFSRYLDKDDRKVLAVFLSFNNRGVIKEYKDFYDAVIKFSSNNQGQTVLAGPTARSSFWKVIDGKFSPQRAKKLTEAISNAARKPAAQREDEFYKQLYKLSDKTPESSASIEELKTKKCFFK